MGSVLGKESTFRHGGLLPMHLPLLPSRIGWAHVAQQAQVQRVCTGEVKALIASVCLKNQPVPGARRKARLALRQEARGSLSNSSKWRRHSCTHVVCSLNHQAEETHTAACLTLTALHLLSWAFPARLT